MELKGHSGTSSRTKNFLQRGAATLFFVAVMLPLFFLFFTLFLDVGSYFRDQQRAQLALDEAALHAARFLPHVQNARHAAEQYLARFQDLTSETQVAVQPDAVSLRLEHRTLLTFAQFFLPGVGVPFSAVAVARVDPIDAYIAFDASVRVIPHDPLLTEGFMENLPAATFFTYDYPVVVNGVRLDERYLTAQCFNNLFSSIKRTAISMHAFLSAFRLNVVGVGVFPSQYGISDVRTMSLVDEVAHSGAAEGIFPSHVRLEAESNWCAAAASLERVSLEHYAFPSPLGGFPEHVSTSTSEPIVDGGSFTFNEGYRPYLRASEAIWSAAGRDEYPQSDLVLQELSQKLMVPSAEVRGGLKNSAIGVGIILSGDLPWAYVLEASAGGIESIVPRRFGQSDAVEASLSRALTPLRELAASNPSRRFHMFYVLLVHKRYRDAISAQRRSLERFFEHANQDPLTGQAQANLMARAIIVDRPEEAQRQISTALVLAGRQSILSR